MTSRNLFFKVCFHEFKKHIWSMAIIFVVMFFAFPVSNLLVTQSELSYAKSGQNLADTAGILQEYYLGSAFSFQNVFYLIVLIFSAVLLAVSGFSYLNSRKKVDFIHSMPIKRESLFGAKFLVGFLNYALPLLFNVGLSFLVVVLNRNSGFTRLGVLGNVAAHIGWFLLLHIVFFLLFYSVAVLAMTLVGNTIIAFLGIGVLYGYHTLLSLLIMVLKEMFYDTYCSVYQTFKSYDPIGLLMGQLESLEGKEEYGMWGLEKIPYGENLTQMYIALVIIVVAVAGAVLLMKFRPSESAGKAMAFKYSEPVIKIGVLAPGIVGGSLFMYMASVNGSLGWLVFGAVVSFLLLAVIMEMIFRLDFKGALQHKWSAFAGGIAALLLLGFFVFDIGGYDRKLPAENQIESIGVDFGEIGMERFAQHYYYIKDTHCYNMAELVVFKDESVKDAYSLAEYLAKNHKSSDEYLGYGVEIEDSVEDLETEQEGIIHICFRLKNGKKEYRAYRMNWNEAALEYAQPVYQSEEYQNIICASLEDKTDCVQMEYLTDEAVFGQKFSFEENQVKEFLEIYEEELKNLSLKQVLYETPEMLFDLQKDGEESEYWCSYPVFSFFDKTLAYLNQAGLKMENQLTEEFVGKITVVSYDGKYGEKEYTDKEEREEILKNCISSDLWGWKGYYDNPGNYEVRVEILTEDVINSYYLIEVPDFVEEDFK